MRDEQLDSHMLLHGGPLIVDAASPSSTPVQGGKDSGEHFCQQPWSTTNPFGSPSPCNQSAASSKPSSGRFAHSSSGTLSGASSASSRERKKAFEESEGRTIHSMGGMHLTTPRESMSTDTGTCSPRTSPPRTSPPRTSPLKRSEKPATATFFCGPPMPNPNNPFRAEFNSDLYKKPPREEPVSGRGRTDFVSWDRSGTYQVPPADSTFGTPVISSGTRSEQIRRTPWPSQHEAAPAGGWWM